MHPDVINAATLVLRWCAYGAAAALAFHGISELLRLRLRPSASESDLAETPSVSASEIRRLLASRSSSQSRQAALSAAAAGGHMELLSEILASGVPPDAPLAEEPPIVIAALADQPDCVRALLDAGANPNSVLRRGTLRRTTVLYACCFHNRTEIALELLHRGGDPNPPRVHGILTPLCAAAYHGNLRLADALLAAGAEINAAVEGHGVRGATAIWFALREGHDAVAERLKAAGADLDVVVTLPDGKKTPRQLARSGH